MASDSSEIRLFNTLTKSKSTFTPLDEGNVRMYVCGPTVYDYAHIGNARPAIVFDVLFRLLRYIYGDQNVTYVRNITDVDDKINARAAQDFPGEPLNVAIRKVTEKTEAQYQNDMKALGCLDPTREPRATEHIDEMIDMIDTLIEKGHAYVAEGHVLFDVKSFKSAGQLEYGKLARRSLDDMLAGARVEVAPYKRDPMDFVLWKPSTGDMPGWESPWGTGRPGWHIECSAMSARYLGPTFDIHGGGIDLSFPHHENELAQSRCAHGNEAMAQVWMHNGFLQVEGEKMSKSLGNFFTVNDLLATEKFGGRSWPGDVLRLGMLMSHYREPMDFTQARLEEAEKMLTRWKLRILELGLEFEPENETAYSNLGPCSKLVAEVENDLNMSGAIAHLHRHASGNTVQNAERLFGSLRFLGIANFASMAAFSAAERERLSGASVDQNQIEAQVARRLQALSAKDFATADHIRDELAAVGIQLMDDKDPESGNRRTRWEMKR